VSDALSKKQRAILEFFFAKLRVRSQKNLKYWSMISPFAAHSIGHIKNPPNHPLHGSCCSTLTLWKTLNQLFDSTFAARINTISNQYTVSIAFDNWQQMITKKWQTNGCSSIYLKGVASFLKKDKAVSIPVGSVLKSPSGALFRVTSTKYIDAFLIVVGGELIINNQIIDQPVGIVEPVIVEPITVEPVIDEQRVIDIERMTATLL